MIDLLLTLTIISWPVGQLLQLSPFGGAIRLQLIDVLVGLLFLVLVFSRPLYQKIIHDPLFRPLFSFILAATVSLIMASFRGDSNPSAWLYLIRFIAFSSVYFAFRSRGINRFRCYLLLAAIAFIGIGLLQYFLLPDVRWLKNLGFDDHYFRLVGSLLDPNFSGLVLVIFTLFIISLGQGRAKLFSLLPLTALALTFSRASFLALALGLIYLIFAKKQFKFLLLIFILVLLLYLVPKPFGEGVNLWRTFSIHSRLDNQIGAWKLFLDNPLFGIGFNTLKVTSQSPIPNLTSGVDNSFLFVLTTTGLVGFAAFVYFLFTCWRISRSPTVKASLIAIFAHSFFNNSLFYSWILILFFLVLNFKPKASVSA